MIVFLMFCFRFFRFYSGLRFLDDLSLNIVVRFSFGCDSVFVVTSVFIRRRIFGIVEIYSWVDLVDGVVSIGIYKSRIRVFGRVGYVVVFCVYFFRRYRFRIFYVLGCGSGVYWTLCLGVRYYFFFLLGVFVF